MGHGMGFFTSNCGELGGSVVLLVSGGISLAQFCHLLSYANLGKVLKLSVSQISYLQNVVED